MAVTVIIFAGLSAVLAYTSRASLRVPRSHGFYRFFAWECILGLFFLNFINLRQRFGDPFSVRQLTSWVLLVGSVVPAAHGVHLLRNRGMAGRAAASRHAADLDREDDPAGDDGRPFS